MTSRNLVNMALLGFGSGLPYLMLGTTLTFWLSEQGVSIALIGVSAWFALPYSLKPLWATFIDTIKPPFVSQYLGHRRGWLLLSQLGVIFGLSGMAMLNARTQFPLLALIASLTAMTAANQDMFVDAWRIEATVDEREAANLLSAYQLGYRAGIFVAGSIVLILADRIGWSKAYLLPATLMLLPAWATVRWTTNPGHVSRSSSPVVRWSDLDVRRVIRLYVGRNGKWPIAILVGVSLFRFPDLVAEPMKNPLLRTFGGSSEAIGIAQGLVGLPAAIAGIVAGGLFISIGGMKRAIIVSSLIQSIQMLGFAIFTVSAGKFSDIALLVALDNISSAITGTVLVSVISSLIDQKNAVVEFAFLTGIYALTGKLIRGLSGYSIALLVKIYNLEVAYSVFFLALALCGSPGAFLLYIKLLRKRGATPGPD